MKKLVMISMTALLVSTPAHAWVRVTNLSGEPQSVSFASGGSNTTQVIMHNRSSTFLGSEGMLALNDPKTIAKAQNAQPGIAGKLLGDLVASNRTSGIPTEDGDSYVVWPDGRLLSQKRTNSGRYR